MTYEQGYADALKAAAAKCKEMADEAAVECKENRLSTLGIMMQDYEECAQVILALPIPDHTSDIPVSKGEPEAWLFKARTKQPNVRLEVWSSVDETAHWPVDQWDEIKIEPLFTAPPQVEAAVEGFRRRAVEVIETSMFEYTCKSGVTRKDMTEAIESLPAFETKGETK